MRSWKTRVTILFFSAPRLYYASKKRETSGIHLERAIGGEKWLREGGVRFGRKGIDGTELHGKGARLGAERTKERILGPIGNRPSDMFAPLLHNLPGSFRSAGPPPAPRKRSSSHPPPIRPKTNTKTVRTEVNLQFPKCHPQGQDKKDKKTIGDVRYAHP